MKTSLIMQQINPIYQTNNDSLYRRCENHDPMKIVEEKDSCFGGWDINVDEISFKVFTNATKFHEKLKVEVTAGV